jgi:hypothetical protein
MSDLFKDLNQVKRTLLELAALCNNTILTGSFSGENMLRASALCNKCHELVDLLKEEDEIEDGSGE